MSEESRTQKITHLVVIASLLLIIAVGYWMYWSWEQAIPPKETDPSLREIIPTIRPKLTAVPSPDYWETHPWLSTQEAQALREQSNVVNLAFLEDSGVLYSRTTSISFNKGGGWDKAQKPFGIDRISVEETKILLLVEGKDYCLNVLQPFVLQRSQSIVYLVDTEGRLWQKTVRSEILETLEQVQAALSMKIEPNQNLSLSYGR